MPSYAVHGPLIRYVKLLFAHAPEMPGTFSPTLQRKPLVSDLGIHHNIRVGIANSRWAGKTFPVFPVHAQPAILRIWQEAQSHKLWSFQLGTRIDKCLNTYLGDRCNAILARAGPHFTSGFSIAIQIRRKFRFTLLSILIQ